MEKRRRSIQAQDEIIAARLSPKIEAERNALRVLATWESMGYGRREIITRALLALANQEMPATLDDIARQIAALQEAVEQLSRAGISVQPTPDAKRQASASLKGLSKVFGED